MKLEVKIYFSSHIVEKTIHYPEEKTINIDFSNITSAVTVEKILVNNLPANIYQNTKYKIANSNVTYDSVHLIDNPGTYTLSLDDFYIQSLRADNWHTSEHANDFIFKYEFTNNSFSNKYRDRDHLGFDKKFIPCFGCSFTYGLFVPTEYTWPAFLKKLTDKNFLNLGVGGIGADAICNNLQLLYKTHRFEQCVILFPTFNRRIVETKLEKLFLRFPSTLESTYNKFHYMTADRVRTAWDKVQHEILEDSDYIYSKNFIEKICNFCSENKIKLFCSSWNDEVYDYISSLDALTLLPKFPPLTKYIERATDDRHPHQLHYKDFADSIKSFF